MIAMILAAGEGTRLRPYTRDRPKCLVELVGKSLLQHQVDTLRAAGIDDITVITGYRGDQIEKLGFRTISNRDYDHTNMVSTMMCAASLLDGRDDVLICYSDIVYHADIIFSLATCPAPIATALDAAWLDLWQLRFDDPLRDAETLKIDRMGNIIELGKRPGSYDDIQAQYMGLIKIKAEAAPDLVRFYYQLGPNQTYDGQPLNQMYMTSFLQQLIDNGDRVRSVITNRGWLEVDSADDLTLYEHLNVSGALKQFWAPTVAIDDTTQC